MWTVYLYYDKVFVSFIKKMWKCKPATSKSYVCVTYLIQNNKHHVTNKIHCNNNIMTIVKKLSYRAKELIKYRKHLIILCPGLDQNIVNSYVVNNINVHVFQHVYVNINVHA